LARVISLGPSAGTRGRRLAGRALACAAALALLAPRPAAARAKTDVVVLVNGDHVTGEIMGMSRGKLDYKTDDAGRLSIEWTKVVRVTSVHLYELQTSDGTKHYGALMPPGEGEDGSVRLGDGTTLPVPDVVSIVPLDAGLLARLQAYLDVGFTLAKSNNAMTLTGDGLLRYRGERLGTGLQFDVYFQDDANNVAVSRGSIQLTGDMYFKRWTAQLVALAEQNDELDLKLRLTAGGGASYAWIRSNTMELTAIGGIAGLREQYTSGEPAYSLTAYLGGAWDAFRYDSPKLDAGVSVVVYPYLTDLGRVRVTGQFRVKYEIFSDFHVGLNLSDTYDSRPPEEGSNNDYLFTFTIGWSYRR
jgi:hypothetical protein